MQLILVSGLSGSGKSIALDVLEDAGFYCIDNLPALLLDDVLAFVSGAGHDRIAVSVDARSAALASLPERVKAIQERGIDCRVIFLEASPDTLLRRYSETRRRHPLAGEGLTLAEAIRHERGVLAEIAAIPSAHRIDTSDVRPRALRNWIRDLLGLSGTGLTLLFESFGYKEGIPLDADWVIDARMLPNPHYEPELRPFTGRHPAVIGFLDAQPSVQRLIEDVRGLLGRWLPEVVRDTRSYLSVAIGCTGGRHRSVYLAERLAQSFAAEWRVLVRHRALGEDEP
jgi:UPF0042 nucleotide-binding protein